MLRATRNANASAPSTRKIEGLAHHAVLVVRAFTTSAIGRIPVRLPSGASDGIVNACRLKVSHRKGPLKVDDIATTTFQAYPSKPIAIAGA